MTWKKVNQSDAGTGSKFGGNDVDKISDAFSAVDVDDIDMNCDFTVRDNKLHYRNPANTFSYNIRTSAITANRDITEPLLTANDTRTYNNFAATLLNKTIDYRDNPLILRENTYTIFKDGTTYYARNGTTGALTSNTAFSTLLQAIIDTIPTRDDTVRTKIKIAPGDYDVNTQININNKYNVTIEGSGRGITHIRAGSSLATSTYIISTIGSVTGTGKLLTANTAKRDRFVTMSSGDASTFAAKDVVLLRSDVDFASPPSSGVSGHQGEIKIVSSVSAGTVTFKVPLFDVYTTANGSNVIKLLPSKNITFKDFSITRHPSFVENDNDRVIRFILCDKVILSGVEWKEHHGQFSDGGPEFESCTNVEVSECHMELYNSYNFQYGIVFSSCCQDCTVVNCTAVGNFRHHFEAGNGKTGTDEEGVCRNIMFVGCTAEGGGDSTGGFTGPVAFDTHPEGEFILFDSCTVLGTTNSGAFKLRSRYSAVNNCTMRNIRVGDSTEANIKLSDFAHECIISGNSIVDSDNNGIELEGGVDGTMIKNNYIENVADNGIFADGGSNRCQISGNVIRDCDGDGIDVSDLDNAVITNNTIRDNANFGIRFGAGTCTNNLIVANWFGGNTSGAVSNGAQSGNVEANNKGY